MEQNSSSARPCFYCGGRPRVFLTYCRECFSALGPALQVALLVNASLPHLEAADLGPFLPAEARHHARFWLGVARRKLGDFCALHPDTAAVLPVSAWAALGHSQLFARLAPFLVGGTSRLPGT